MSGPGTAPSPFLPLFQRLLSHRRLSIGLVAAFTAVLASFAARVRPDFSVEMFFPRFHRSRIDYERYKKAFPHDDARALVVVEAPDVFQPAGLRRIAALQEDLARIDGVLDTDGLATVKHLVADGEDLRLEKLFPSPDLPAAELAARRTKATTHPLYAFGLATPDGRATTIRVTLTEASAGNEESRTRFLRAARQVVARHEAAAAAGGATQKLTLNGLPVIRSEFTELITADTSTLFPAALVVVLLLLYGIFRRTVEVVAALVTILFAVIWTVGLMGIAGVPLQTLTQLTPILVMIISISDTVHIVAHVGEQMAAGRGSVKEAIAAACAESAGPCLLTEVTIAGGFVSLALADMVMIQQFGLVTAAGMLLTWLSNVTVLPLALSFLRAAGGEAAGREAPAGRAERAFARAVMRIERIVLRRRRLVPATAILLTAGMAWLGWGVGTQYYCYDDLRPGSPLAKNLRYVEEVHGGSVPLAVLVEPREPVEGAMLEPEALALLDRIERHLEEAYPADIKNASSLASLMKEAHRLLAGPEEAARSALPGTREMAAQELLFFEDEQILRDIVSFDRSVAAVAAVVPDHGSHRATKVLAELRAHFAREEAAHPGYRVTVTGIYGVADGIYQAVVGGLARSLATAVAFTFVLFCFVLRSWQLAIVALVPNLLPLPVLLGMMSLLGIDVKPTTVMVFSVTLVIADDDTIQYLARFRRRFDRDRRAGLGDRHTEAAVETLRETGLPMLVTTIAVSLGFLTLLMSQFLGLAYLGLLIGISLLAAVLADLFLSPLLIMMFRPKWKLR